MNDIGHFLLGIFVAILGLKLLAGVFHAVRSLVDPTGYADWKYRSESAREAGSMAAAPWVIAAVICLFFAPCLSILLFLIAGVVDAAARARAGNE